MWQNIPADTLCWLLGIWLFAVGGCVGSFLNVVVYRLPRGMSLLRPPSHCPGCGRPIRWFDNVPIFGWLWLRGRCRGCRTAIAFRYPLVEAVTACLFLGLGLIEWLCGGTNLPPRPVVLPDAVLWPARTAGELAGIFAYHLWLLCTLWAAALIEYDGDRPPRLMLTVAILIGVHAPLIWPWLHPQPAFGNGDYALPGAIDGTIGLAAGVLLGALCMLSVGQVANLSKKRQVGNLPHERVWPRLLPAACVGVYLGWQAVCVITPAAVAACLGLRFLGRLLPALRRIGPIAVLLVLTVAAILGWSQWAEWLAGVWAEK